MTRKPKNQRKLHFYHFKKNSLWGDGLCCVGYLGKELSRSALSPVELLKEKQQRKCNKENALTETWELFWGDSKDAMITKERTRKEKEMKMKSDCGFVNGESILALMWQKSRLITGQGGGHLGVSCNKLCIIDKQIWNTHLSAKGCLQWFHMSTNYQPRCSI